MPLLAPPASALNNAVPFLRPPAVPPSANGLLPRLPSAGLLGVLGGALLLTDLVGKAGGYKWRDDLLSKIGGGNISKPNGSTPPFTGGQAIGINYRVFFRVVNTHTGVVTNGNNIFTGAIGGVFGNGTDRTGIVSNGNEIALYENNPFDILTIERVERVDGLPDTDGNPNSSPFPPVPFGYTPSSSPFKTPEDRKVGTPSPTPNTSNPSLRSPSISPSPVRNPSTNPPNPSPSTNPPTSPLPSSPNAPSPSKSPLKDPPKEKDNKPVPPVTPNPTDNKPPDLGTRLRDLIGIAAVIAAATQFDNLKNAAKTGSCETLKSPSCTKDMEDRIKDPIRQDTSNLLQNVGAISSVINTVSSKVGDIFKWAGSLYNNQFVQSSINYLTLATTIHNAALLSRDIGETLGSVVDNGLSLAGRQFKDSEGQTVQFTEYVGNNAKALIVNIIGAERYIELTLNWQRASSIFNSAAQILNTTQSMLDPISSAVEYGMENVSKIGNSLKEDGVVSENAYPAMDETIRARTVNRFERLNDTLEGAENIASNLSNITSSAVSVKEDYKQLREDAKDLKDKATAFNTADSEARAALKAELPTEITPITLAPAPAEDEEP